MVVMLSKDTKKAYDIFFLLREKLPEADVCTLRHISVYIARTNDEFDVDKDLQLILSDDKLVCKLLLKDGSEISFPNNSDYSLNFIVDKNDDNVNMTLFVSTQEANDLSTSIVVGNVVLGDWSYVISSDDYGSGMCCIKVYHNNILIDNGTSYFNTSVDDDIGLDCIDGLGHLTSIMTRVELLYNNLKSIKNNKLVRKK